MKKTKAANIKVRAACITGPVHLGRGQLCQDRCRWSTRGANFVAVVSDGAGSTKYGRIGAKIVCDTLVDLLENAPFKDIRAAIVKAIGVARDKLAFHRLNSANNKKASWLLPPPWSALSATRTKGCFPHRRRRGAGFHLVRPLQLCRFQAGKRGLCLRNLFLYHGRLAGKPAFYRF